MNDEKPVAWNMENGSGSGTGLKDIRPGDMVDQRQAINTANRVMGDGIAKEMKQDQQYRDDTKKFVNEASTVESQALVTSREIGIDAATAGVFGYFVAKIGYWFTHPIPGAPQTRGMRIFNRVFTTIVTFIVLTFAFLLARHIYVAN